MMSGTRAAAFQDIGKAEKRRFILKAAAAAFGARGFHATTVGDIARRAGIAHGTFYLYFSDKKDVYRALSAQFQEQIEEAILPGGGSEAGLLGPADLAALVRERLAALALLFESEEGLARVFVYRTPGSDPEFEEQRRHFVSHLTEVISEFLRAGVERGLIRPHEPRVAALCLVGSVDMVIESWLHTEGERTGPSLLEMTDAAARFILPALLKVEGGLDAQLDSRGNP